MQNQNHVGAKYEFCPACKSSSLKFDLNVNYWNEFPLAFDRCADCGATFANPMPTDQTIATGNEALVRLYELAKTPETEFREARQAYLRGKLLARKLMKWKYSGRALELGCYHGFYSLGIKDSSRWEVEGVEISKKLGTFVNEKLKIKCHIGTLEGLRLPDNSYDFIICHDLIEHINRPDVFIKEIFRILKPGGRIQIITPNAYQDLAPSRRLFDQGHTPHMLLNHIFYFTPDSLKTALEINGFKVVKQYSYYIQHVLKDFGWLGFGKVIAPKDASPSAFETLRQPMNADLNIWTDAKLEELKNHKKVGAFYGFYRETLPELFTVKVPPSLKIGHEIYALAQKI
ncbi:MAG: class I SAM-dependent methyltransferase [Xanthomonadaceae bacterium]|nr:class I SAM-dependent methyltransferase [Xanthomonadaceae bacterium]